MTPQRILVREVNWLGDLVMTLPALRAIRSSFPAAHLAVLAKQELIGFFDAAQWIDQVVALPRSQGLRARWRLAQELGRQHYDTAIILPRSFNAALLPALAMIPRRVGAAGGGRGWLLTEAVRMVTHDPNEHQSNVYKRLVQTSLGIEIHSDECSIDISQKHRAAMQTWLSKRRQGNSGPLIALAPAAAYGPAKEWPATYYSTLIDLLATNYGAECVLIGSPSELGICQTISNTSHSGALIAAGRTSIGQVIALLSLCDGFAGNDSGSMHVAGACGIPTVGIFGSTNPTRTGPLGRRTAVVYEPIACSPCLARTCRFGHYDCLKRIRPESIVQALESLGALHGQAAN